MLTRESYYLGWFQVKQAAVKVVILSLYIGYRGMATHSSILTWRIPWTEEPGSPWLAGRPQSMASQRARHDCV